MLRTTRSQMQGAFLGQKRHFKGRSEEFAVRRLEHKTSYAHDGHVQRGPIKPKSPWEAPVMRVGAAVGLHGPLQCEPVSVVNFVVVNF